MARYFVAWQNPSNGRWEGIPANDADQAFDAAGGSAANTAAALQTNRTGKFAAFPIDGASLATWTTSFGSNADLTFAAKAGGPIGNLISIRYVVAGNNTALSVTTSGLDITVNVATSAGGAATSTANAVKTALDANAVVTNLLNTTLAAGSSGVGVVAAMAQQFLVGGSSGAATVETLVPVQNTQNTPDAW